MKLKTASLSLLPLYISKHATLQRELRKLPYALTLKIPAAWRYRSAILQQKKRRLSRKDERKAAANERTKQGENWLAGGYLFKLQRQKTNESYLSMKKSISVKKNSMKRLSLRLGTRYLIYQSDPEGHVSKCLNENREKYLKLVSKKIIEERKYLLGLKTAAKASAMK